MKTEKPELAILTALSEWMVISEKGGLYGSTTPQKGATNFYSDDLPDIVHFSAFPTRTCGIDRN
jgi:hypothetical protein